MSTLTLEQINAIVETAVRAALQVSADGGGGGGRHVGGGRLDERFFRRVDKYGGEEKGWREWSFAFKSAVGMANVKILKVIAEIEKCVDEPVWEDVLLEVTEEESDRCGAELYAILTSLATGEAMTVLRGVPGGDGWMGWWKMVRRFDPKTPARALRAMMSVMQPKKVKDTRDLAKAMEEWEVKIKQLKVDHDIDLDPRIMSALLVSMLPSDFQDSVFQWTDGKMDFKVLKDKVLAMALNRASVSKPTPMEVDSVDQWETSYENWAWVGANGDQEEEENGINYVGKGDKGKGKGKGACWTCGEFGHRAVECPKGGKGGKSWYGKGGDNSKVYGNVKGANRWNGNHKGDGKGGKSGWAAPLVKACFSCGSTSHLARDCPNTRDRTVQEVRDEASEPEVLFIGHTEAFEENEAWQEVRTGRRRRENKFGFSRDYNIAGKDDTYECGAPPGLAMTMGNGFRVFEPDEPDEDEEREAEECSIRVVTKGGEDVSMIKKPVCKGQKQWAVLGLGDIVVDSAADESCWPKGQGDAFPTKPSKKNIVLKTANGGSMGHYGEKEITFQSESDGDLVGLKFQVTDVKKPLLAVRRLVEKGNVVNFGPEDDQNFIYNPMTGRRIPMEKKGGSFVIKAHFMKEVEVPEADFSRRAR